jgi:hypothetical protein
VHQTYIESMLLPLLWPQATLQTGVPWPLRPSHLEPLTPHELCLTRCLNSLEHDNLTSAGLRGMLMAEIDLIIHMANYKTAFGLARHDFLELVYCSFI